MGKPIRVLQVFARLDRGGAETMIMNIYRKIDRSQVQFDFVVNDNDSDYSYEKEIKELGGRVFRIPRFKIYNYFSYKEVWFKLLRNHPEWKIIHGHHTSPAFVYLKVAKSLNRLTIAHSHTSGGKSKIKLLMRYPLRNISDYLFACNETSAKWMFGKNKNVHILNNAIDAEIYKFSEKKRHKKRKDLNINNNFVIGHVGNFSEVKNYPFILDVFKEILTLQKDSKLLLIGKKESSPEIEKKVKQMNLEKEVIFTGVRSDVPGLLQAMDVFLFPSIFEGLGMVVIEAQATGLKCIISDSIPKDVKITDNVEFISLEESPEYWAKQMLKYENGYERKNSYLQIIEEDYDVKDSAKWLMRFYIDKSKKKIIV